MNRYGPLARDADPGAREYWPWYLLAVQTLADDLIFLCLDFFFRKMEILVLPYIGLL